MGPKIEVESKQKWTAGEIMEGRALDRGYSELIGHGVKRVLENNGRGVDHLDMLIFFSVTAKGGRPDGNRAANASKSFLVLKLPLC